MQSATYSRLLSAAGNSMSAQVLSDLDARALLASQDVSEGVAIVLPDNQWKLEVINFNSIMLAYLKSLIVSYVTGPLISSDFQYIQTPNTVWEQKTCDNQLVTDKNCYCFSVLRIMILLGFGLIIISTNFILEPLMTFIQHRKKSRKLAYKELEWDLNNILQLQRMVYEGQGSGTLQGASGEIPLTSRGDKFGIPRWTGTGDAKRNSQGESSSESVSSPLIEKKRGDEYLGLWEVPPGDTPLTSHGDEFEIPHWTGTSNARRTSQGETSSESASSPLIEKKGEDKFSGSSGIWKADPDNIPLTSHSDKFGIPHWTETEDARRTSQVESSAGSTSSSLINREGGDGNLEVPAS